jgi:3'(2'),5'-bisphosphate nucleotidase
MPNANADPHSFLSLATDLAQKASGEILKLLKNPTIRGRKADNSIVTEADLKADEIIRNGLSKAFPDHAILTEETALSGSLRSEFVWLVDPLDGTKAYAKGIPGFCVMIGLLKEGRPYLGVIVDPLEGRLYQAIRREGAFHFLGGKKQQLQVSSRRDFREMPLALSTDFPKGPLGKIQERLHCPVLTPINSVGIKTALLARQVGDLYINHHSVSYWDTCAPQILLEEAGGAFTRWDGAALTYPLEPPYDHRGPTLASNGTRHEEVLRLLSDFSF